MKPFLPVLCALSCAALAAACNDGNGPAARVTVSGVSPSTGPLAGGTPVTIAGTSFVDVTGVTIGGAPLLSLNVVSGTQITGKAPSSATPGAKDVVVASSSHASGTCAGCFTHNPPVTVSAVSPGSGPTEGGTSVTIAGTNFPSAVDSVRVGAGRLLSLARVSGTQLRGTTAAGTAPGAADVTVYTTDAGDGTCTGCFTYYLAATASGVSPTHGPLSGGTAVTIAGANFPATVDSVRLGAGRLLGLARVSGTQLTGSTPAATGPGAVDVTVYTSSAGIAICGSCFSYDAPLAVTGVGPASGPVAGGTAVTVFGTSFPATVDSVRLGTGRLLGLARVSDTQLTGTTPAAGAAGAVSVTAYTSTGTASCPGCFTYVVPTPVFDLSREIFGTPRSLSAWTQGLSVANRSVTIGGADSRQPTTPFTFDWGDGQATSGFFNQTHVYGSATRSYVARVTAHYADAATDFVDVAVHFVAPQIVPASYPAQLAVTIPTALPVLASRQPGYLPPAGLVAFDDSWFGATLPRADVAYVLSQAAAIEAGITENDIEQVDGGFRQVVLRDPAFGGAYSLWFTSPVAFGASGTYFQGTPGYSSLFHEMGHNFSLNAPAAFRYGGRIDGSANAIFSEAVAQMFQHAVAYEMLNNAARYGIPEDLALDIANSARASAQVVRGAYDQYVGAGMPFSTWNDPATPEDETFGTFMTVARQFLAHAEQARAYIGPLTRAMRLLRTFDQSMLDQYAPQTDGAAASTFRATLLVAALSYGFQADLRAEFRNLHFPIDDAVFTGLVGAMP